MPRKCCIPECKSNYDSTRKPNEKTVSTFTFPKNEDLRRAWIRAVPRKDWTPTKNSAVCAVHFSPSQIVYEESVKDSKGNVFTTVFRAPKLVDDAVPHIFPNLPKYLSKPISCSRTDPDEMCSNVIHRHEQEVSAFLENDIIKSFEDFVNLFVTNLVLIKWAFKKIDSAVIFYLLNTELEDWDQTYVTVLASVSVYKDLSVKVFVRGHELHFNQLKWILSSDMKISRWSQMENILARYVSTTADVTDDFEYCIKNAITYLTHATECDNKNVHFRHTMSESALCRTCARPAARLQPLFNRPERYKRYALALKLATGLQIEMNDGLPQYICTECCKEVNRMLKFRTNSQKAETRLLELGYRKNKMQDRVKEPTSTEMKKELVVQEKNFDSDESLDTRDHDEEDDFSSFAKVENLGPIAKNNFSNGERMKSDDRHSNKVQRVKSHNYQLRLAKYLDTSAPLYTCKECKKNYVLKGSFVKHTLIHTGLEFMCDRCGKVFWTGAMLLKHQRAIHGAARDVNLRCQHCVYHAIDKEDLKKHIRIHTGEWPYICDTCGACFTGRPVLIQHLSVHMTERNVLCKECPAKFRTRHQLHGHVSKSHKPRRWRYRCAYCIKTYNSTYSCRKHMRKFHGIPNDQQEKYIRVPFTL